MAFTSWSPPATSHRHHSRVLQTRQQARTETGQVYREFRTPASATFELLLGRFDVQRSSSGRFGLGSEAPRSRSTFADVWLPDSWSGATPNSNISIRCRTSPLQKIGRTEPLRSELAPASHSCLYTQVDSSTKHKMELLRSSSLCNQTKNRAAPFQFTLQPNKK
jgi:hypothetical protein